VAANTGVYIVGPIIAFLVVGALAAILRWTFDNGLKRKEAEIFAEPADYGLLQVAAVVDSPDDARAMQRRLDAAGIRATVSASDNGRINVLVFDSEIEAARRLVGGPTN
jgi:hypothetical protein